MTPFEVSNHAHSRRNIVGVIMIGLLFVKKKKITQTLCSSSYQTISVMVCWTLCD